MTDVNRKYKDTVFRLIFNDKEKLLELYNAVNGSHYTDVDELEINTLQDAVYMNMKNDISFVLHSEMNLYEHQSTVNPNMPLRDLFYVSDLLSKIVSMDDVFGSRLLKIPMPRFIVFYNGTDDQPEISEYKLSSMYEKTDEEPALELVVKVYNINPGNNALIVNASGTLSDYVSFVAKVREHLKSLRSSKKSRMLAPDETTEKAVHLAVDECIEEGILREFLIKHKAEVIKMSIYEYNEELHLKNVREEGREEGREEALKEIGDALKRERQRADAADGRAEAAEAELAKYRAKYGPLT